MPREAQALPFSVRLAESRKDDLNRGALRNDICVQVECPLLAAFAQLRAGKNDGQTTARTSDAF
ncbi:MAG: hypothetical protein R3B13_18885 [Polyangiaceae bacterium]